MMLRFNTGLLMGLCFLVCAQAAIAVTQCQGGNENAAVAATTPTNQFTLHDNGTVTDNMTGLMWMRCSLGQTWVQGGSTCTGTATTHTWQQALQAADTLNTGGYAGHSDWRLPNKNELESIVESRCWSPAINTLIFPNTLSARFWSSSPDAYDSDDAWGVDFVNGFVYGSSKGSNLRVRLVRAGQ